MRSFATGPGFPVVDLVGLGVPSCLVDDVEQLLPGAGDPRADRSDGHAEQVGGFVVLEPAQLRQDERRPPVVVETGEELVDLRPLGDRHRRDVLVDGELADTLTEATATCASPCCVDTGASGDREEPVARGPVGAKSGERRDRPTVGLLRQVLGVVAIAQVAAQIEDVAMGRHDELLERVAVATLRVEE